MTLRSSFIGRLSGALMVALFIGAVGIRMNGSLRGAVDTTVQGENDHPILAPCSRFEERYKDKAKFDGEYLSKWEDMYHETVDEVIEEHLKTPTLTCDASTYAAFLQAGPKLEELAKSLPTWQDNSVRLSRFDLGRVLLEYLRVYECALDEYENGPSKYETALEVGQEEDDGIRTPDPEPSIKDFFLSIVWPELLEEDDKRLEVIKREKIAARETLNRTLGIISALDRLRPLEMELQCMQQVSLDIRNITALSAEASACFPRAWTTKDILRDVK